MILAPLLLGFSLIGIVDGDIVQAISWAIVVLISLAWLLAHRALPRSSRPGNSWWSPPSRWSGI